MGGSAITNPTIAELLREFAAIQDDDFIELQLRQLHESQQNPRSLSSEELAQHYYKQDQEKRKYVEKNKPRLLQGLIGSLETTLQGLQAHFYTPPM